MISGRENNMFQALRGEKSLCMAKKQNGSQSGWNIPSRVQYRMHYVRKVHKNQIM